MNTKQIKNMFWKEYPEFKGERRDWKIQNQYKADIRITFCDFIDRLHRDGLITDKQVSEITL